LFKIIFICDTVTALPQFHHNIP